MLLNFKYKPYLLPSNYVRTSFEKMLKRFTQLVRSVKNKPSQILITGSSDMITSNTEH